MKFFIDSANLEEIKKYAAIGIVDGVTTNPTLVAKEHVDFETRVKEICAVVDGPVSAEVVSETSEEMLKEAKVLASWAPNVCIKVPMTFEGLKAVKQLSKEGIMTNMTLVFSVSQALLAAKAGATFVSPFVGRLDDISEDGMGLIEDIMIMYYNYGFKTEIIVASIRHPLHVVEAAKIGAHVATIPPEIVGKLIHHPLTEKGIERFLKDWESVKK
jgi:transaldolase